MARGELTPKQPAIDIDALCAMIEDGEPLAACAEKLGRSRQSLYEWINYDPLRSARVNESRKRSAAAIIERTRANIEAATNPFSLAKAKELAHHDRWHASKIAPKEYGDKIDVAHSGGISITVMQSDADIL